MKIEGIKAEFDGGELVAVQNIEKLFTQIADGTRVFISHYATAVAVYKVKPRDEMMVDLERIYPVYPTCETCKYWHAPIDDYSTKFAFGDYEKQAQIGIEMGIDSPQECADKAEGYYGRKIGRCMSPLLGQRYRPGPHSASAIDGENYFAGLLTDYAFGCINHNRDERPCD